MGATFKSRLNTILKKRITPLLKELGFRKRRNLYEKWSGNLAWLIDIQWGRWGDKAHTDFTMNCGVFIKGVMPVYIKPATSDPADVPSCSIHTSIGMLGPDKRDQWWELLADDVIATVDQIIGKDISIRLQRDAIPFLNRFHKSEDVLQFLVQPRAKDDKHVFPMHERGAFLYAAIIASLLDRQREKLEYLDKAIELAKGSPVEEVSLYVRDRLLAEA